MSICLFYVTFPSEESATELAGTLVRERFAACFNAFPIRNMYWWQGAIESGTEWVAILKTTVEKRSRLQEAIQLKHPYEVPCILTWLVEANPAYEAWIQSEVREE